MGAAARVAEQERFWRRLADPAQRAALDAEVAQALLRGLIETDLDYQRVYEYLMAQKEWSDQLKARVEQLQERLEDAGEK